MKTRFDYYMDNDVAYLMGLIIARGTIIEDSNQRKLIIEFSHTSLNVTGIEISFEQDLYVKLGLADIRERLLDLLDTDIKIVSKNKGFDFIARFHRPDMIWRNILRLTNNATSYPYFCIPPIFFGTDSPIEWKREFLRGFADVAGNVRKSNHYRDGRHRVRLDVLNKPTNWEMPIHLCRLLQEHLDVPVNMINWGHPNLGRDFREHQVNIFAQSFLPIGFTFKHKQTILEELATYNEQHYPKKNYDPCPGIKRMGKRKPSSPKENNAEKLDPRLVGNHYDRYWQICKALGCQRMPVDDNQIEEE